MSEPTPNHPKVTIITVVKNAENTIGRCVSSILEQTYPNIEIIIVDGNSKDNTLAILRALPEEKISIYSEADHGIYDALNKGLARATGDIVGLLHGDDYLANKYVLQNVVSAFEKEQVPILIGQLSYFHPSNIHKIVRRYYPAKFKKWMFRFGIAPPHPGFYAKKELFERYGNYRIDLEIAGDFDLMLRFLYVENVPYKCIEEDWVMMSTGGKSTSGWKSILKNNSDIIKVCKDHRIQTNTILIYTKYFLKLFGLR